MCVSVSQCLILVCLSVHAALFLGISGSFIYIGLAVSLCVQQHLFLGGIFGLFLSTLDPIFGSLFFSPSGQD